MDFGRSILFLSLVASIQQVYSLKCYSCNNIEEPKCGKTWELSDTEAEQYIVNCTGDHLACKKIDTTDSMNGNMLVTRTCWSASKDTDVVMNEDFLKCSNIADLGNACYCTGTGDKPCNGKQPMLTYVSMIITGLSVVCVLVL